MAQRKKKLTKKKRHPANREPEADSDSGDFELAAEVKDDDSVSICTVHRVSYTKVSWKSILACYLKPELSESPTVREAEENCLEQRLRQVGV